MRVKYGEVDAAFNVLEQLAGTRMSRGHRLEVRRVRNALQTIVEPLHEERNELIIEHGEGEAISPQDPGWAAFVTAYNPLLRKEVEVEVEPLPGEVVDEVMLSVIEEDALVACGIL